MGDGIRDRDDLRRWPLAKRWCKLKDESDKSQLDDFERGSTRSWEGVGKASAAIAAASFATLLEAEQIAVVEHAEGPWYFVKLLSYLCLGVSIPLNLLMYDFHQERCGGRQWIIIDLITGASGRRYRFYSAITFGGWLLGVGGIDLFMCVFSLYLGIPFLASSFICFLAYGLYYRPRSPSYRDAEAICPVCNAGLGQIPPAARRYCPRCGIALDTSASDRTPPSESRESSNAEKLL